MQIVIDEKVSETSFLFKSFLKWLGNEPVEFIFLSKHLPDRSESAILEKILPKYRNLLTKDQELHNRALEQGFASFTLDEKGAFTVLPVEKVRVKKAVSDKKEIVPAPFEGEWVSHRLMDTLSGANQERMRGKIRRIRQHFQEESHMESTSLTIASEEILETVIGGYFLKIQAKKPFKTLQLASEGYCLDSVKEHLLSPIFHALSHLYCLELAHLPVILHIVSPKALEICSLLQNQTSSETDLIEKGVKLLLKYFPKVEILPCSKGPFFERMQSEMYQIKHGNTNEVVALNFELIAKSLFE